MSEQISAPLQRRVLSILKECLIQSREADCGFPANALIIEAVTVKFAFSRERLERHRRTIAQLCDELPPQFQGDGLSFLLMCWTRDDQCWGQHRDCEHLLALALATGQAKFLPADREAWKDCPGGVPYVAFATVHH
jgi:hypothetical protein